MRITIFFLICFLSFAIKLKAQEKFRIEDNSFYNLDFNEFVERAERMLLVKFFYDENSIKNVRTTGTGCQTVSCALHNLFEGTSLYFLIEDSGNIVITDRYAINIPGSAGNPDSSLLAPEMYNEPVDQSAGSANAFFEVGNPAGKNLPGNVTLSGYVTNSDTREPLQGVTVYVQKLSAGTVSNAYGYYSISLPRGAHLIQFSFIGMREKRISVTLNDSGELNIDMKSVLIPLKEATVTAGKNLSMQRFETGTEKINVASLKLIPTSMGEPDIMKSILLVPGVNSVGEGSAGFNVRGGTADQNLVLLYGAPVYNSSHFFGFFSTVNSDIIKDVTLYKGGIPARYGGRISSVFEINSREGNRKEFAGNTGISPITAHISLEGPIVKDTLNCLLTARTTYSNWVLDLIDNPSLNGSRASFYDINGKVVYDYNRNNKFDLSLYTSHDDFRFRDDTVYSYGNKIASIRWRHFFSARLLSAITLNNSFYSYEVGSTYRATEAFKLSHFINSTGFRADFNLFHGNNEFNFGLDLTRYSVSPGSYSPANDSSIIVKREIGKERGIEGALYVEDKIALSDILSLNMGIRFSSFLITGPSSVMVYNSGSPKSVSTINDTIYYGAGRIIRTYGGPELRIAANFRLEDNKSLKLNYNKTRQYLHLLSNSASISPTDTWKLSDWYLKPQTGDQVSAGFYHLLPKNAEASVEIFYKWIKNMVDFKGGTSLIMNETVEKDIISMKGKAYGAELLIRKTEGKIRYSLGYTYSRTLIRSAGLAGDEILNHGRWYPANYDRPHDLMLMFSYIFSRRFSISSNYTWSTGRPVTYPVTAYRMYDDVLLHYSDRNKYRLPDYSRLDLSFRINGNLRSKKLANPYWNFSVYNVLGRKNIYSVFFRDDGEIITGYSLSVFGTAIPSLTFGFDF
ncbi:MAG TPA: TonB-dependent receptor [Bacteroidales bacterium]|nr:TonB-dependent receptor [Bacteroidales bacterium]